jgi:phytoene dehydrogenase-like protein
VKQSYDAIVVGAGLSGGLPCAAYLQKAGLAVLLLEANAEPGVFCPTHETWPGALDSPHVGVSFAGNSPVIEDLELERYGFRFKVSPVILGCTYPDGTNALICQEPARTAENFAKHSQADGERMFEIQTRVHERFVELNELKVFSPHPDPDKLERVLEICAYAMGFSVEEMSTMTAPEICERTFESDAARQILVTPVAFHEHGAPFGRGQGAFGIAFALFYTTGVAIGGNEAQVEALTRCFIENGGTLLTNCPVESIEIEDGRAVGVILEEGAIYPRAAFAARHGVVSNAGVPETLRLVGSEAIRAADPRLASKMSLWKMGLRSSAVTSWLLSGPVPWGSRDFDPLIEQALLVYRAFDNWKGAVQYLVDVLGNKTWDFFGQLMEFVHYGAADPHAVSPEGHRIMRAEEVIPAALHGLGGIQAWDGLLRDEMLRKRNAVMERIVPGWSELVLDQYQWSPLDCWRLNRSAAYGQAVGGDFSEDQWILDRMPYRFPIPGLYMSNGVWPVGLSWMAAGYNAAGIVAEDAGVRDQPWWKARPAEWYFGNLDRLLAPLDLERDALRPLVAA